MTDAPRHLPAVDRAPSTRRRTLAWAIALGLLTAACQRASVEQVETEAPVPVVVEAAKIEAIQSTIAATGTVMPAPGAELTVVAPAPARIAELPKAEGDAVRKGDILVRFDIPSLAVGCRGQAGRRGAGGGAAGSRQSQLHAALRPRSRRGWRRRARSRMPGDSRPRPKPTSRRRGPPSPPPPRCRIARSSVRRSLAWSRSGFTIPAISWTPRPAIPSSRSSIQPSCRWSPPFRWPTCRAW